MRPTPLLASLILAAASVFSTRGSAATCVVTDFGATGRDIHSDTEAIQKAIDHCASQGGGQVIVPTGTAYTVGTIVLRSHVDLHLERGAVLKASPNYADFTRFSPEPVQFEAGPKPLMGVMIYAESADDVALTGPGRIDGNDMAYVTARGRYIYTCARKRPFEAVFRGCTHVLLREISLTHSAFWTLRIQGCDDVSVDAITIDGDLLVPNNDGIDVDWSSNVRIHGCNISTGDDCISLKTAPLSDGINRPCENVVVSGCTLRSRSSGVVLGCDAAGPIRDVVVSDCVIKDSHRGVAVRLSLEGSIERVLFQNLIIETRIFDSMWWGRGEPIQVLALPWTEHSQLGQIRDIRFSNLICTSENGAIVYADSPGHIQNVSFDHVSIRIVRPGQFKGGQQDLRPYGREALPSLGTSGYLLREAQGVSFRDCSVAWGPNPPDYFMHLLDALNCPDLSDQGLSGNAAHPGTQAKLVR